MQINNGDLKWDGDGVGVEEAGVSALGLVEDHLVTYLHGKDLVGYLEEEHAGIYSVIHGYIHMDIHIQDIAIIRLLTHPGTTQHIHHTIHHIGGKNVLV